MSTDFRTTKMYRAVVAARTRLRGIEEKHEQMLDDGAGNHRGVGREYAAAVQDYTNAVMAWLSALETTQGRDEEMAPPPPEKTEETARTAGEA